MTSPPAIGREALIPNPCLKPFEWLVGEWRTTGSHPDVPGTTFHGRTLFEWTDGGAFLTMRSEIDEPEIPSAVGHFGADDKYYFLAYFDERGVSRKYEVSFDGDAMVWTRNDPKLAQSMTFTRENGGTKIVCKGRKSESGGPWSDDLSLTYTRLS